MTSRRDFVKRSLLAGGALGLGGETIFGDIGLAAGPRGDVPAAPRAMRILILGGTGFIGTHQVPYAVARGHQVTVFNRGRTQADLPASVERLRGDRNTGDLKALEGRSWDVVIDNPTRLPFWVRDAGRVLGNATEHYIFVSTISVYADASQPGRDEDTPLLEYEGEDPLSETQETVRAKGANRLYGPLKAAAENEAEKWFPGKTTVIRPGLIVGPGDETGRFTYWPVRIHRGGEVLAPNKPEDPVQFIDVRDLAEWMIRMAETKMMGIFNATGPARPFSIGGLLDGIKAALDSRATFTWVPASFLDRHDVSGWIDLPVWVPPRNDNAGFARTGIQRALDAGLTFRPLAETATATLAGYQSQPEARRVELLGASLTTEKEQELLRAWHDAS